MAEPIPARSLLSLGPSSLRSHPRVAYQGLFIDPIVRERMLSTLPALLPFKNRRFHGALAILDWDHSLPSRRHPLRIYTYYDAESLALGEESFDDRLEDIAVRDHFPEFDVPDFGDLPADEAYEAEVEPAGVVVGCRLTSSWRRDVSPADGKIAVSVARASAEFARVAASSTDRPRFLGDLDAVSYTPPCETGHNRWTIDVWYLLAFDGRIGSGRSLLVDPEERKVVTVRDFSVRTG
jgi:hypothetical protein